MEQVHCFGSEVGMEDYLRARPDIFFTGPDGSLRSNRAFCQTAGLYAGDMFIGSTLKIDLAGHSSTVTANRVAGFGGAPNIGSDACGRRHPGEPWLRAGGEADPDSAAPLRRGRKLVVQIGETFGDGNTPMFVERLAALDLAEKLDLDLAPVMVYSDDVSHVVTGVEDSNLLYRGRAEGLAFAQDQARRFLADGGLAARGWQDHAAAVHDRFVARRQPGALRDPKPVRRRAA